MLGTACDRVVMVPSGTAALEMAALLAELVPGDEVRVLEIEKLVCVNEDYLHYLHQAWVVCLMRKGVILLVGQCNT